MDANTLVQFKDLGPVAVLGLAAVGSAMGIGAAGMAAVGAWKKGFLRNKPAPMVQLLACIGAPISQTFYGMILMGAMLPLVNKGVMLWSVGVFAGAAIGVSAYMQGKIGAAAADALGESEKGFSNYLAALGIVESVAVFVMVFTLQLLGQLAG
jgi:V/A-type H+-transporting ATPase subunit K